MNRQTIFTVLSFVAAPAVPALAALLAITPNKDALLITAAFYGYALLLAAPIAVPAFLVLRRRNLINWWSATFTGTLPPLVMLVAFRSTELTGYFAFGALGGLSGFVFWLVWRMGHRDHPASLTDKGAAQSSATVPGALYSGARYSRTNFFGPLAVALFFAAWGGTYWHSRHTSNFDAATWRENVHDTGSRRIITPRHRMADGLLRSNVLRGKTREEVEALLGPDTETDKFRDCDLVYWLGPERGFVQIDSDWLVIKFANDGRVADVRIVTD